MYSCIYIYIYILHLHLNLHLHLHLHLHFTFTFTFIHFFFFCIHMFYGSVIMLLCFLGWRISFFGASKFEVRQLQFGSEVILRKVCPCSNINVSLLMDDVFGNLPRAKLKFIQIEMWMAAALLKHALVQIYCNPT